MPICVHGGCVKGHVVFVYGGWEMLPRKDDTNFRYDFSIKSKNTFSEHHLAGWPLPRTTHVAYSLLMPHGNYDLRWVFASNSSQLPPALFSCSSIVCIDKRQSLAVHHIISCVELSRRFCNYELFRVSVIFLFKGMKKSFNIYKTDTNQLEWFELNWVWHTTIERTRLRIYHGRHSQSVDSTIAVQCKWSHIGSYVDTGCEYIICASDATIDESIAYGVRL